MNSIKCLPLVALVLWAMFLSLHARGSVNDDIGFTVLKAVTTNLNGAGIRLAQPEASLSASSPVFEVDPGSVGQPVSLFEYYSGAGSTNAYPNAVGTASSHAIGVANILYGIPNGLATNLAHVDNLDADYYYSNYVANSSLPNLGDQVVNQSFTFGSEPSQVTVSQQQQIDSEYDNYAVQNNTLFISAANNGGSVSPPGTAYNCIGVGALGPGSSSSIGPTLDNGRCKPDICGPGLYTSESTPFIAGAAALLMQAAARGDGGGDTTSAGDMRTVKALILNGAVKPADWTNAVTSPLDARYGAGLVNILNSYEQLAYGKHGYSSTAQISTGAAHPPGSVVNPINTLSGWDFNTNTSSAFQDSVAHYYFNVTNAAHGIFFTVTATLVWNRAYNSAYLISPGKINNLSLYLYNVANGNLVAASTSTVDNVQHFYVPKLSAGQYDLQVLKPGGFTTFSASETYALAFDFVTTSLTASGSGNQTILKWPVYPGGFGVVVSTNLNAGPWLLTNLPASTVSNGMNVIAFAGTNNCQFFRLQRPNF